MVFFHGGAFFAGGINKYNGYAMMNENVILVLVQYRLGILASVKSYPSAASSTSRRLKDGTRRRPQEFDGTVSWEAYKTQCELLASARQLRGPGETLTRLAQDLEVLVRRAYPEASEEMITILLRDQFVDAIDNQQLRIYVQQAHPKDLQEALARGLEVESFLRMTWERPSGNYVPQRVKPKKGAVQKAYSSPSPPLGEFRGKCYSCGQQGHTKRYCPQGSSSGKAVNGRAGQYQYKPCCWNCGQGHKTAECALVSPRDSKEAGGNGKRLVEGVERQPESQRPQSA
ncbi:hypothetical protein O3P69_015673 [Scylla paramamosain]|uniref:CCHC-type domain-containing protein n=1 Tax=Scylla paramamosain TaxID=85552 RepID=A0AAW0SFZ8_SCYPA